MCYLSIGVVLLKVNSAQKEMLGYCHLSGQVGVRSQGLALNVFPDAAPAILMQNASSASANNSFRERKEPEQGQISETVCFQAGTSLYCCIQLQMGVLRPREPPKPQRGVRHPFHFHLILSVLPGTCRPGTFPGQPTAQLQPSVSPCWPS